MKKILSFFLLMGMLSFFAPKLTNAADQDCHTYEIHCNPSYGFYAVICDGYDDFCFWWHYYCDPLTYA